MWTSMPVLCAEMYPSFFSHLPSSMSYSGTPVYHADEPSLPTRLRPSRDPLLFALAPAFYKESTRYPIILMPSCEYEYGARQPSPSLASAPATQREQKSLSQTKPVSEALRSSQKSFPALFLMRHHPQHNNK